MEVGMAHGFAQDLQYDKRIADARYHNQQMQRAKAENEASLKAFEDDTDYMNAANSFDHNIIKNNANNTIKQMGEIIRNNPDYRYNPDVRRKLKELKVELKSNADVIRGMASDKSINEFNDYLKEAIKNPAMHSMAEIAKLKQQQQNYLQYGHQDGKEAAAKLGPQAFVFQRPKDWVNLNEEGLKTGALIKARKYKEYANGGNEELVDEDALKINALDFYNRYQGQIKETFNPKTEEEGLNYAASIIRPGISLKREFGKPHYNDALELEKWKLAHGEAKANGKYDLDPYMYDVKRAEANRLNTDLVQAALGTTPQAKIYNKDGVFIKATEGMKFIPDGGFQQTKRTVGKKINPLTGAYEGYEKKSNARTGVFHGYVEMTEQELDDSGLLNDKAMKDLITSYEGKDAKDKPITLYRVKANVESDLNNEGFRTRYNSAAKLTSNQMDALNPLGQMEQNSAIPSASIQEWMNAGWTKEQIQQGVQQGVIKAL
jgi:hypothetical protein